MTMVCFVSTWLDCGAYLNTTIYVALQMVYKCNTHDQLTFSKKEFPTLLPIQLKCHER